jgi:4-oxalocrotonate tautomerase
MPYVNIKITRDGVTAAQKARLIAGATELLARVLGKNPATTVVVIDEVDADNWGIGGEPVALRRSRAAADAACATAVAPSCPGSASTGVATDSPAFSQTSGFSQPNESS